MRAPPKEILIAEDSATQALKLKTLLEENGYKTYVANNGEEALKILEDITPNIIITDIMMPVVDGFELCRQVKANKRIQNVPVILLTSLSSYQDVIKSIECGANAFLTKPYQSDSLLSRIEHINKNETLRSNEFLEGKFEVYFNNKKYQIQSNHFQVIDLLLSTFESAVQKNQALEKTTKDLLKAHQQLKLKNDVLVQLNEQMNNLVGMTSHDLRTPIGNIVAFSTFLLKSDLSSLNKHQKEMLERINSSSHFMLQLLDDLLDISEIESGKLTLNLEPVNLSVLLKKNVNLNQILAQQKDIKLNLEVVANGPQEQQPILVTLDPLRIEQVLNNLISNAIKYSYPTTVVDLTLTYEKETAIISIKDEGQGIPKDELEQIFKPFCKASVQTTQGEKSTGLGLAIVRKIVQEHKGRIWVESKAQKGSTFYVALPIFPALG